MRKLFLLAAAFFLVASSYVSINSQPTGAPAAASGGPAEGNLTCTQSVCHFASPGTVTDYITTDIPSTGYVPGKVYNFTVSFAGTGNKGFQLSAQDSAGNSKGTFIQGAGSKLTTFGSVGYITHSSAKSASTATWTFQWRAPLRGSKRFSIWGAFAITRNTTKRQNFFVYQNQTTPVVTTLPPTSVSHQAAMVFGTANANTGVYNVSFHYKAEGGNWTMINALPSSVAGDTATSLKVTLTGLAENTRYTYRTCAWNNGDTTWADTLSFVTLRTGINEQHLLDKISVYPQPASTEINVSFNLSTTSPIELDIFSLAGDRVHHTDNGRMPAGSHTLHVPLNLNKGIYLMRIHSENETATRKIVIQ